MSSLNNNFINKTFNSLLKLFSNESFTGTTTHTISDGLGNTLPISFEGGNITVISGTTKSNEFIGGVNNISNGDGTFIGGGFNNTINGSYSAILGGQNNYVVSNNSFIIGSNITATTDNTLSVENLSITNNLIDHYGFSGDVGQVLSKNTDGVSWITVSVDTLTGDSINQNTFYTYTSETNTLINTKLNIDDFNIYSSSTNTLINTKLNIDDFNIYSSSTNTLINGKLNISDFKIYSANTQNRINEVMIVATSSTIYNSNLTPSLSMPFSVGGLSSGTTVSQLTGLTFSRLFDDLLFPTSYPTYTIPTISISGVNNTTSEVGSTITPTITISAIKNDGGVYNSLKVIRNNSTIFTSTTIASWSSSIPNQFGFSNPNNPNSGFTITPYSESYVIPSPSGSSTSTTTIYKASGNYISGLAKPTNKNTTDSRTFAIRSTSAPQSGSTGFETSSYTYTGIYPYFYGTSVTLPTTQSIMSSITGGTATKVLSDASGTLSVPYNNTGTYIWVAYYNGYTTKTKWYVSALDNGNNDGSFITAAVNQDVSSPTNLWNGVSYKLHWSTNATTQSTLEYRNN